MKVTPLKRKFGKYAPGDVFELKDRPAKLLIRVGKLAAAPDAPVALAPTPVAEHVAEPVIEAVEETKTLPAYETRMLTADVPAATARTSAPTKRTYTRRSTTAKND